MHFHFSFYSSVLLIFFSQGLLFTILLAKSAWQGGGKSNLWLSAFILLCTLNISVWMLGHAGWYSLQPYRDFMLYFPFQHFFLLGPCILFYTQSILNPTFKLSRKQLIHFLPGILYIFYSVAMFVTDKLIMTNPWFYADGHDRELDAWYHVAGIISLSFYLFKSLHFYSAYRKLAGEILSVADLVRFNWIKNFLVALFIMQMLDVVFFAFYPQWGNFTSKWWYYFAFSIIFYYVAISAYGNKTQPLFTYRAFNNRLYFAMTPRNFHRDHTGISEDEHVLQDFNIDIIPATNSVEPELEILKANVERAMVDQRIFCDSELSLLTLARHLDTNSSVLSRTINKGFGMNFNDFVNSYRVNAVKQMLNAGSHKEQTLLGVAMDCGFNSKTTFNRAFKKHASVSPKEYLRNMEYLVPNHDSGRPVDVLPPSL